MVLDTLNNLLLRKRINKGPLFIMCPVLLLIGLLSLFDDQKLLVYNHTPSVPLGFYWLNNEPEEDQFTRGELIVFNVPDAFKALVFSRGWLNPGESFLKPIAAQSGDFVCTKAGFVRVNQVSYGRILNHDSKGRPLTVFDYCGIVNPDQFFVFVNHEKSFDSRYYGPIDFNNIIATAKPLWTY